MENPENFRHIDNQRQLFPGIKPLFVSRYPQSKDLVKWLSAIPNRYLHFGDFDFAGINIYLNEYKKHLGSRSQFFVPDHIEEKILRYGSRHLYDKQLRLQPGPGKTDEPGLNNLISLIHTYKKGLEQEIYMS
jgi:hypothetical protein